MDRVPVDDQERLALCLPHHEKSVSIDGQVRGDPGGFESTLAENVVDTGQADSQAELDRVFPPTHAFERTLGGFDSLHQELVETRTTDLETDRIDIGDVVTDHAEPGAVGLETGNTGKESTL